MRALKTSRHLRIWGLAFGYFLWYIPYSALTKALSQGTLPGAGGPVPGFVLLPATALATSAALLAIVLGLGRSFPRPRPATLVSGIATAVIIATTTLNYTFVGISILLALLLMRGGVLILAPIVDALFGRRVRGWSWGALSLSLAAVVLALADVGSYHLTLVAGLNIAAYLAGYLVRINTMTALAKSEDEGCNRRYFLEETAVAAVALSALPAACAFLGRGTIAAQLREGFTGYLAGGQCGSALVIGLLYACLYLFGTGVYLDRRENTFCIPLNRCSSLLSGLVSSYGLAVLIGARPPSPAQLAGAGLIVLAQGLLILATIVEARRVLRRLFLFVCGGNTSRSPMAQAICNDAIARRLGLSAEGLASGPIRAQSAGLTAQDGRPLTAPAASALRRLGVAPHAHASRPVSAELVAEAERIFCMSDDQRAELIARFPEARAKVELLDPEGDIDDPTGRDDDAYHALGGHLDRLVRGRLEALLA